MSRKKVLFLCVLCALVPLCGIFAEEIIITEDMVLDEPMIIGEGQHITLIPDGGNRTITRGSGLIEYPVIWVQGENASLTLGRPDMEYELTIDGGYLSTPPIEAHCPLVAVSGPDSKLIMYDNVVLQNNYNNGTAPGTSHYQNGAGVFIRTEGDIVERQAEFIMKGGTVRGNINNIQTTLNAGGGVFIAGMGIFTMEGGVIMGNTAQRSGGGFMIGSRGSFKKIGGIIYGKDAPIGYRNIAIDGTGAKKVQGHAVVVAASDYPHFEYRDDTVGENDSLSYTGVPKGVGVFGQGEKWNSLQKIFRQRLIAAVILVIAAGVPLFLIIRKLRITAAQKRLNTALANDHTAEIAAVEALTKLSPREKEILNLLFSELTPRQIAQTLSISYSMVNTHSQSIYRKLNLNSRIELVTKFKSKETKEE